MQIGSGRRRRALHNGVTEALNNGEEEFGEERLLEAIRQFRDLSPPDLLTAIADEA
jgi:serine phosphatase RsbU (regulator of sigma subunit)